MLGGRRRRCPDCAGGFFEGDGKCAQCNGTGVNTQLASDQLSSLFRNVPGLTSIEVSPFWPSETARFFFLAAAGCRGGGKVGILLLDFHFSSAHPQSGFLLLLLSPISHRRRRSCGNVGPVLRTQGVVERGEILPLDFHAFHTPA